MIFFAVECEVQYESGIVHVRVVCEENEMITERLLLIGSNAPEFSQSQMAK